MRGFSAASVGFSHSLRVDGSSRSTTELTRVMAGDESAAVVRFFHSLMSSDRYGQHSGVLCHWSNQHEADLGVDQSKFRFWP